MLDVADQAATTILEIGANKPRRLNPGKYRVLVWSETTQDWDASVQIEIATPSMKVADVWIAPDDLRFTANRVTSFEGGLHVRAIATGVVPEDLKIEFI